MSGLITAGNLYLDRYVNGSRTGEHGPLNATALSITLPEAETVTRKSTQRDSYGNTLDSVILSSGSGTVSIELDDCDPEVLVYAMLGTVSDVAASSGSASDETIVGVFDRWTKLANRNVSGVVVGNDATPTTTYTAGTDYLLDATAGMIKVISTGAITDGQTLYVDYNYAALSAKQILANQSTEIRTHLRLDGTNLANQKKIELIIPESALVPGGEIALIGEEFVKYTLSGEIVLRDGESAAFTYREID